MPLQELSPTVPVRPSQARSLLHDPSPICEFGVTVGVGVGVGVALGVIVGVGVGVGESVGTGLGVFVGVVTAEHSTFVQS